MGFQNWENSADSTITHRNMAEQLLLKYKLRKSKNFFEMWSRYIPENVKKCEQYKILTLNLHVYFAILPKFSTDLIQANDENIMPTISVIKEESCLSEIENDEVETEKDFNEDMMRLQQYLSTEGKELKYHSKFRVFFALPYIEDPLSEPLFCKILNEDWFDKLSTDLQTFIATHLQADNTSERNSNCHIEWRNLPSKDLSKVLSRTSNLSIIEKTDVKNNIPIIPNDRNLPVFLDTGESDDHLGVNHVQSKTIQIEEQLLVDDLQNCNHSKEDININPRENDRRLIQYFQEIALARVRLCHVQSNYKKLKSRYHKLHSDYHKLLSVAGELTTALENSVKGELVDLEAMLESCIKIFPDLFNQNVRNDIETESKRSSDSLLKSTVNSNINITNVLPRLLDYKKIKMHLINGNVKSRLLLLQALRWKITISQSAERDEAMHEYIRSDLLGLHCYIASANGTSILPYLLIPLNVPMPHPLQQSAARLLNAFASLQCGRDYLSVGSTVVKVIFNCLDDTRNNGIDAFTYDMTIATLQKLSLRKQQRIYMIENGLVEWLIYHLYNENTTMSSYRLRYATALLMNLSLHKDAQKKAAVKAPLLISTLMTLLTVDFSATPYIIGSLNNFLTNDDINEEAKKIKLLNILESLCKQKTGEMRKQLDHVLKIHKREYINDIEDEEMSDNDNDDFDVLENELEEDDPVKNHKGELCGDTLLATCYLIHFDSPKDESIFTDIESLKASNSKLKKPQDNSMSSDISSPLRSKHAFRISTKRHNLKRRNKRKIVEDSPSQISQLISSMDKEQRDGFPYKNYSSKQNFNDAALNRKKANALRRVPRVATSKKGKNNKNATTKSSIRVKTSKLKSSQSLIEDDETVYIYENQISKDSSNTTVSSVTASTSESRTDLQKFSSIASLNSVNDDNTKITASKLNFNKESRREENKEAEEQQAFLAKPRISRTPPHFC